MNYKFMDGEYNKSMYLHIMPESIVSLDNPNNFGTNCSNNIDGVNNSNRNTESPLCLASVTTTTSICSSSNASDDLHSAASKLLCTHDGVLLKKANSEYMADLNTSGSLSFVEYLSPRRFYIEWKPNDNILIADDSQDQGDWALVDTISRRSRTASECKAFNIKPVEAVNKLRKIQTLLDDLSMIEVKHKGQTLRFVRKLDNTSHLEFFFQHGNADLFISSMRQLHVIDVAASVRGVEKYIILPTDTQRLRKTFAELDIGEIKTSTLVNDNWLSNKLVGFLSNIPDYVTQKVPPKSRPGALQYRERRLCLDDETPSYNTSNGSSLDKSDLDSELENVKEQDEKIISTLPERRPVQRGTPLNMTQWLQFQTVSGNVINYHEILQIISHGGIEPQLRCDVWKYLLKLNHWDDTELERFAHYKEKSMEFYKMKAQWLSMTTTQESNFSGYRDRKCQIEKDVKRTDRSLPYFAGEDNPNLCTLQGILMTYVMYNFDLGYVQGMSDLLAPILTIMQNEVDAFWCFVGFMDMVFANFDIDQAGMKTQFNQLRRILEFANPRLFNYLLAHECDNMYFCFRWLLVWYKREFSNDDILRLWECLWTRLPCPNFHLFVSVAIFDQQTDIIIENKYEFTDILKHVNELADNINLAQTLELAEAIYQQIKEADYLPNDIRQIIGLPLLEGENSFDKELTHNEFSDDGFDELVRELSPQEKKRHQEELDEACERSMFLQYL